jgi:hypothetical protein
MRHRLTLLVGICADFRLDPPGNLRREDNALKIFSHIKVGFIERQRLDNSSVLSEYRADLQRYLLVNVEPRLHEDQVWTFSAGGHRGHRRSDAECARLIARGCNDTTFSRAADGDRLAPKGRIVALLHRRIEGIHVNVDDLPWMFLCQSEVAPNHPSQAHGIAPDLTLP